MFNDEAYVKDFDEKLVNIIARTGERIVKIKELVKQKRITEQTGDYLEKKAGIRGKIRNAYLCAEFRNEYWGALNQAKEIIDTMIGNEVYSSEVSNFDRKQLATVQRYGRAKREIQEILRGLK